MAAAGRSARPSLAASSRLRRGKLALRVDIVDASGRPLRSRGLPAWLRRVAPARARGSVTIVLVSDTRMRALNRMYRGKDYATDVLSFGADTGSRRTRGGRTGRTGGKGSLGDVVIARGVARRQAAEAAHSVAVELRVLALHGLLHLLGYDHERDNDRMRRVERRLRRKGGLREGLIERASE
jgi:probable rRNA maturation factor